jgi:DNA polymerase-3 subunit alpha
VVRKREESGPFRTLNELCAGVDQQILGKRALEALIKAGALDCFGCGRKRLLETLPEIFEQAKRGQMGLFNDCSRGPAALEGGLGAAEWDEPARLAHERDALGFYLSDHPLSRYLYLLEKVAPGGTAAVRRLGTGSQALAGGVVEEVRSISSRRDEPLRFLRLEDLEGTLEVVAFADTLVVPEQGLEKGACILVSGLDERVRLIAAEVVSLEEAATGGAVSVHLHLEVEGMSPPRLRKLARIIGDYPGGCPIFLHFHLGRSVEVVQRLASGSAVRLERQLEQRLGEALGEECLQVRYGWLQSRTGSTRETAAKPDAEP